MKNYLKNTLFALIAGIILVSNTAYAQRSYGASAPMNDSGVYSETQRPPPPPQQYQPQQQQQQYNNNTCRDCGTVDYIREVEQKGEGSGLGLIGGAVVGGLLGNQIGGGKGKTVGAVVGAVGGGYAGNEIEKSARSAKHYEITVRFDDGNTRVYTEAQPPALRTGDRVRVNNGQLMRM